MFCCKYSKSLMTVYKYLCNLAGTDYELPEDDCNSVETFRGSVIKSSIINR